MHLVKGSLKWQNVDNDNIYVRITSYCIMEPLQTNNLEEALNIGLAGFNI